MAAAKSSRQDSGQDPLMANGYQRDLHLVATVLPVFNHMPFGGSIQLWR